MRWIPAWILTPALAFLVPLAAVAGPWPGRETVKNGVPHLQSPAEPMEPPVTIGSCAR